MWYNPSKSLNRLQRSMKISSDPFNNFCSLDPTVARNHREPPLNSAHQSAGTYFEDIKEVHWKTETPSLFISWNNYPPEKSPVAEPGIHPGCSPLEGSIKNKNIYFWNLRKQASSDHLKIYSANLQLVLIVAAMVLEIFNKYISPWD